jgi:hypothetical protein
MSNRAQRPPRARTQTGKAGLLAIAVTLMAVYIVFIVTRMARSHLANVHLLAIAIGLGLGVLAGGLGLASGRR